MLADDECAAQKEYLGAPDGDQPSAIDAPQIVQMESDVYRDETEDEIAADIQRMLDEGEARMEKVVEFKPRSA